MDRAALVLWIVRGALICGLAATAVAAPPAADAQLDRVLTQYVHEFLRCNPVVATYLGGAALAPTLAAVDGALRDYSPSARTNEARFLAHTEAQLKAMNPATLSAEHRIDREVALRQIAFLRHQYEVRKYWRRSLDTYVKEPFRGVDWALQGMASQGGGRYGTENDWRLVIARVAAIPRYLETARRNLEAGINAGDPPDWRLVERDGLITTEESAKFFGETLPRIASERTTEQSFGRGTVAALHDRGAEAAEAFRHLRTFIASRLATLPHEDRFALGAKEYEWALHNNLGIEATPGELYERSWPIVAQTRSELVAVARQVAHDRHLAVSWDPATEDASVRAVFDVLSRDVPRDDAEIIQRYRDACQRLVDYGRANQLFDIPAEYSLDVTLTPPVLQSSIDGAAYYTAPPFKGIGVGRFYVTATHGDPELLKQHNRAAIADLAAHEGFPGHDWHYKAMTRERDHIAPVRWLTPGEVEGSASMWADSMAVEGWALYAESLVSEPTEHDPHGFYTPEELIYQLQGRLLRDLRVRIDTGIHTGRLRYDDAVDLLSGTLDFLPGSCRAASLSDDKRASCTGAEKEVFRYSKWPTQAITYQLGKERIRALRSWAQAIAPGPAGERRFHELFLRQGTIPPDLFAATLLSILR